MAENHRHWAALQSLVGAVLLVLGVALALAWIVAEAAGSSVPGVSAGLAFAGAATWWEARRGAAG